MCPIKPLSNSRSKTSVAPHLALIAVQILFATWPIVGKVALRTISAFALVGFRVAGATILLVGLARVRGQLKPIRREDWPLLIISSALGLIFNQWLFVKGLSWTTAINSTLISTSIPIATLLVGIVLGTDRATWRRIIGIAVSVAGVLMLIGPGRASFSTATRAGDLLIVANSFCYGAYIAVSKDIVRRYSTLNVITWIFVIASIATIPAGPRVLIVAQVGVQPGSWAEGKTVAGLESSAEGRLLLLSNDGTQHWRPAKDTPLAAGQELVVVVTRRGLAEVLACTERRERET